MASRPKECNKVSRPLFACIVFGVESLVAEKLLLCYAPFLGEIAFDDFNQATMTKLPLEASAADFPHLPPQNLSQSQWVAQLNKVTATMMV
jgi:hypothetical protein